MINYSWHWLSCHGRNREKWGLWWSGEYRPLENSNCCSAPDCCHGAQDASSDFSREAWNCAFMWHFTVLNYLFIKMKVWAGKKKNKTPHICRRHQTHSHQYMTSRLNGLNGWKVPENSSHMHNSDLMSSCSWITRNHRILCEKSLFCLKPLILQGQKLRSQQKPHRAQEQISGSWSK